MDLPIKLPFKISNVLELAGAVGGNTIILTAALKGSPENWQYLVNMFIGASLIFAAIWLYHKEKQHETRVNLIHGAFNMLCEIKKREAEQLASMGDPEKVKIVSASLDKIPDKILSFLKEMLKNNV